MIQFKNKNIRGQRDGTHSQAIIDRVHERARVLAHKYRTARSAYMNLQGPETWENTLRVLLDGDIRSYQDPNILRVRRGRAVTIEDDEVAAVMDDGSLTEPGEISLFNETHERRDGTGESRRTLS